METKGNYYNFTEDVFREALAEYYREPEPKTKKDFYKLMQDRRKEASLDSSDTNCIGTALYLTGEIKIDEYLDPCKKNTIKLKKLKEIKKPILGCLVALINEFNKNYHLAVVVKEKPLMLSTRNGYESFFTRKESFTDTDRLYSKSSYNKKCVKFFLPSKLQKILGQEDNA